MQIDFRDNSLHNTCTVSITKATSAWQDVGFSIPLYGVENPSVIVVGDDANNDGVCQEREVKAGYPDYLTHNVDGKWKIIGANGVIYQDVTQCRGRDIYINCQPH
jgi:hypothetical protein